MFSTVKKGCAFVDSHVLLEQINIVVPSVQTRRNLVFKTPKAGTNVMLRSPNYIMCKNFNVISSYCDIFSCTLNQISRTADLYLHL